MITVGFSTRKDNQEFIDYVTKTCGINNVQVIQKINNGEKSLSETYNEIFNESVNDIVVLCHDDILFETKNWGKNLLKNFEKSEYGILGLAGSVVMPSSGKWWDAPLNLRGIVNHQKDGKKWESKYSPNEGKISNVVVVDGLFISLHKGRIKETFDTEMPGFHFYDLSFSFSNYLKGVKVGVTYDVRVTHLSLGETPAQWDINRQLFVEKHKNNLPLKYEEVGDLTTFVMCHDQKIIKSNIESDKFKSLGNVVFMYVGKGEFTELEKYPEVIIVRDLKHNIEQYPLFTAFTAWYAIWRQGLCKTKYINLLEYDVNLKEDYSLHLKNILLKHKPKIVGYFPLEMRNYHYIMNPGWVSSVFKGIQSVYKLDMFKIIVDVVNKENTAGREPVWATTNNVCFDYSFFDKYMRWVSPLISHMKDDINCGHNQERAVSFFCLLTNTPVYFYQGYLEHVQADSHGTQGHEVTKKIEL